MNPAAAIETTTIDDATMLEVAELATRAGVAIVERAGQMRVCGAANIPPGWHRVGFATKRTAI